MKFRLILRGIIFVSLVAAQVSIAANPPPITPLGRDGKPLNLDFEDGTLKDWTATGTAFNRQPIRGDSVSPRRGDMKSNHQGDYWVGTYEVGGDEPQGTLTSAPFAVTQPFAAFLVAGGSHTGTRVELVRADTQDVFFKTSGYDNETLRPVVVDLAAVQGKEIFIRLVDEESSGWGHINFDDFKFYASKPVFSNALDASGKAVEMPPADIVKFAGLPPQRAAQEMTFPPGFKVTLFAGEPDVAQPIAFCTDDRGRLWVAEGFTYPKRAPEGQGKDRIVIFEDTNGDGKFDKKTVFMDGLNLVSGLQVGFGGVWVGASPYLMFIPMKDGDEPKPAGPPQILLDGWNYNDTHETLNTFTWGPDGWLYGCHGVFNLSKVGKPGTPDKDRMIITCGVWRLHPVTHEFEYFSEGTSNPWGIDFDEHGQCFIEGCVIPHLWHMIQGAHYQRQGGNHVNPYVFDDIKTIADHVHYAGNQGPHAANGRSDSMGGGHAHAGMMIYQGGSWPKQYSGMLFMNNVHGVRMNMDIPERQGSGFVGHHGADFALYNDAWAQMLDMQEDQDGSMCMIDWYDSLRCHNNNPEAPDRSNGRIYKVVYGDTKWTPVDLQKKSDLELVNLLTSNHSWLARHAQRILQERTTAKTTYLAKDADKRLEELINSSDRPINLPPDSASQDVVELRALWTYHVTHPKTEDVPPGWVPLEVLNKTNEYARAWAIQLLTENSGTLPYGFNLVKMANDKSPVVRLYVASATQRIEKNGSMAGGDPDSLHGAKPWDAVEALLTHSEDANDHNLPLMYWYALEPLVPTGIARSFKIAESTKIPRILEFTARRVTAIGTSNAMAAVVESLGRVSDDGHRLAILNGLTDALRGQRKVAMPQGWDAIEPTLTASANSDIRSRAEALALVFGSPNALASLRKTMTDEHEDIGARRTAMESLLSVHDKDLALLLQEALQTTELQGPALRGLAAYNNPKTAEIILALYPNLPPQHKRDALNTLVSRAAFAKPLLAEIETGKISVKDLSADLVRQMRGLKDQEIADKITKLWGVSRDSSADMKAAINHYRDVYRMGGSQPGNASKGRAVFAKTCQQCHTLFETGGHVGPDLTGSQRADLEYILLNVIDPNAIIPNDYRASIIELKDGRSITGIVTKQDDKTETVVTANETLTLLKSDVDSQQLSPQSMMPEGLLQSLSDNEVRDLIYYLSRPGQVPFPVAEELPADAAKFFNGKDLSAWDGDPSLWKVENSEIVGKTTTGLKHNEFIKSRMQLGDFHLTFKVKLVPDSGNSGVQFHSERFGDYEMKGPQADIGVGYWGTLYEENGRGELSPHNNDQFVKKNDWNTYEIVVVGSKVRTAINGHLCVDMDDPKLSQRGITGLQVHAGGPTEVRFKDIQIELNPKFELTTLSERHAEK